MLTRSCGHARKLGAVVVVTLALACSDSTAPVSSRIRGTYDLSTSLESLTYSVSCQPTSSGTRCTDTTVDAGASRLYGNFTLGDTIPGTAKEMKFAISGANFHLADCATSTSACTESVAPFTSGSATVSRDSLEFQAPIYGAMLVVLNGTVGDGEITGQVSWHTYLGCCAVRYYSGTFVARRQR